MPVRTQPAITLMLLSDDVADISQPRNNLFMSLLQIYDEHKASSQIISTLALMLSSLTMTLPKTIVMPFLILVSESIGMRHVLMREL